MVDPNFGSLGKGGVSKSRDPQTLFLSPSSPVSPSVDTCSVHLDPSLEPRTLPLAQTRERPAPRLSVLLAPTP